MTTTFEGTLSMQFAVEETGLIVNGIGFEIGVITLLQRVGCGPCGTKID